MATPAEGMLAGSGRSLRNDHRLNQLRLDEFEVRHVAQFGNPAGVEHGEAAMDFGRDQDWAAVGYIELFCRSATQILKLRLGHEASPPTRQYPSRVNNMRLVLAGKAPSGGIRQYGYNQRQSD